MTVKERQHERDVKRRRPKNEKGQFVCAHCNEPVKGHKRCACGMLLHEWNPKYKCKNPECRETYDLQHNWEVPGSGKCIGCYLGYNPAPYVAHKYEEMAIEYGYSRERVRQLVTAIEAKLKENPMVETIREELEVSRNNKTLQDFVEYCQTHPELRFWQALASWSDNDFILAGNADEENGDYLINGHINLKLRDTFHWE